MRRIIIYFITLMITCPACDNFLEQEPGTQTSTDEIFSSYTGYKMALNGCYYSLEELLTGVRNAVYADALGGNIAFTPSKTNYGISVPTFIENIYSFADLADDSDMDLVYDDFYGIINAANIILDRIPGLTDATDDQVSQLKAEVLCIRAICHFYLARYYAQNYSYTADASHPGIICNTKVQQAGKDYPARKTVKETYDIIITDLQTALNSFTPENILAGPVYSYFNNNSCKALLARVALYAQNYQLALDYASDVIENSGIALLGKDDYIQEWEKPNTPVSEIIFELSAKKDNQGSVKTTNTLAAHFGVLPDNDEFKDYCASPDLLNLFDENDIRGKGMYTEASIETIVEGETETAFPSYFFTNKFQDNPGNPVLRMSEMYLIRAEAYARLNETESALTVLNTLRAERGALPATNTDNILDEIFTERRKELCFEGHLFFDIARFHKNAERYSGCIATTCNLNYPSYYFILPIPKSNTDLNSNLEQNEGYN
ncbi:RagB/SusD family nutrient uptake outer membrane protein [Plebeiibacterium marinum]|uniref:RagB/SusD family nutrient uptake outer membrane protein n=1 Tax=Plebeiibacterium marinum TaxID=2992111 RepID=A0AAE3MAA9_9BACT|nr:RagB/SusD family nutrient uptake outer membrane protein [Plebeiobacterium marinum]MCW3804015.1 RagB/SusD family nutrient uptake outer membrane protein [Plebeiobacterium marinum]